MHCWQVKIITSSFAASGVEGLALATALKPDAVLLDVMMPGMDGFEVCRRLRADDNLEQVAIIMITALDDRASRLDGLRAGADEFLSKPFDSVELKTRLQTIARLGRYRRLLAERTRVEWMVEQSEDGYVLLDAGGNIRFANPRARAYLNLPEDSSGTISLDRHANISAWSRLPPGNSGKQKVYSLHHATWCSRRLLLRVLSGCRPRGLARRTSPILGACCVCMM